MNDLGKLITISNYEISKKAFEEFAANAARGIAMRNANMKATEITQVLEG